MQTQLTLNVSIEEKVDVRSLIVHGDIERDTPKAKREQHAPEFERVLMDGADCAFRRRCGSRSQMLVLLVTQGQYYVTDERTGSRHALTTARLGTFCKGATGDALTPPWSAHPLQDFDAKGRAAVVALLNSGDFREMCKRDMVRVESWAASRMGANAKWNLSGTWEHVSLVWRLVEPTMGHSLNLNSPIIVDRLGSCQNGAEPSDEWEDRKCQAATRTGTRRSPGRGRSSYTRAGAR